MDRPRSSTTPPLDIPQLPLLFYFFYADVDAVIRALGAAGVQVTRTGHPPHALGGEVKVLSSMPSAPGHGLWLARQVADRMSMVSCPGGTRVIVAFNLP